MAKPLLTGGNGKANDLVGTSNAQIPTWSEAGQEWVPGPGVSGSGNGGATFFFNFDNTSGITPNSVLPATTGRVGSQTNPNTTPSLLGPTYNPGATTTAENTNLDNGTGLLIAGFVTAPNDPGVTTIFSGLWDFNIWAAGNGAAAGSTQISMQAKVYIMNGAGTAYGNAAGGAGSGVPLAVSDQVYVYDPTVVAQYILNVTMPQTVILATDRIYIEIWAQKNTASGGARGITLYFETARPSHVHTTIQVPVNLATQVAGILPVANGGTGAATANANKVFAGPVTAPDAAPGFRPLVTADFAGLMPYDLRGWFPGTPAGSAILDRFVADRAFTISADEANQYFRAIYTTLGASVVLAVKRNGTNVFTVTFASGDPTSNGYKVPSIGTVDTGQNVVALGDIITIETVGAVDALFTYPLWTIYGSA
jgi:hypothetical protein